MRVIPLYLFFTLLILGISTRVASAEPVVIAYDMVNSASSNLISHSNSFENSFTSPGDGFQKYSRVTSASIPFSIADDSLLSFPTDTLGIIDENNLDTFFAATDTVNPDTTGPVSAQWQFDISGLTDGLVMSIDVAAMGDFEASDYFTWSASIDGGTEQVILTNSVDEASSQSYTMAGGAVVTLNDPMLVNGIMLSNLFTNVTANIPGTGSTLTLTLEISTDGGSEAFAFQNLVISTGDIVEPELTLISAVQGSGIDSPLVNNSVIVEAIVVGDFQNNADTDNGDLGGFYLQEEDVDADSDPYTSEGVFIADTGSVDVNNGDLVRVTGTVTESFGMTSITAQTIEILSSANVLPTAAQVSLPVSSLDEFEIHEGMRVSFPQALIISEYYNFDRFGEIVLAQPLGGEARPMTPTTMELPGTIEYEQRASDNILSRITLDDGRSSQNPDPAIHPNGMDFNLNNLFRGGDYVQNATGIMDYRFSLYRIQPTMGADYVEINPRPQLLPNVGGDLTVASFNVLNYFSTLDVNGADCGPEMVLDCRGADNAEEFTRQRDKIINAIAKMDADIVGLIEIENNATAAISDLVTGLNATQGENYYSFVDTSYIGTDAIKAGFLYKTSSVSPSGDFAILDSTVDATFIDDKNRPVLAQTFESNVSGDVFTVAVNHFKSKGSDCIELDDPDLNDGQGNCNVTRTNAATALASWLATDPTGSGDDDFLIIGDLNAYDKEDPITALVNAGYSDLLLQYQGEEAYSYVFDGQFGYLDYALANTSMGSQVTGAAAWHINADEPDILDYNTDFKQPAQIALYETNEFRSSDHDPVIVGITLNDATQPLAAFIDTPAAETTVAAPVNISGTATADEGIQRVLTGVRDQATGLWWTGNGWGNWMLHPATVTTVGDLEVNWETSFALTGGSGRYRVFARAIDTTGEWSESTSHNFMVDANTAELSAVITNPEQGSTVNTPVSVNGTAFAPAGVGEVLVGIRDQNTLLWLQEDSSWGPWNLVPATLTTAGDAEVSWEAELPLIEGSGSYRVFAHTVDLFGVHSESDAHNFLVESDSGIEFNAQITSPEPNATVTAAVNVNGTASAPAGVQQVRVGIRDQNSLLWLQTDGSWGDWVLHPVSVTTAGDINVTWTISFDLSAGSGNYRIFARADDTNGIASDSSSHNFNVIE